MGIPLEEIQAAMKAAKKPAVRKAADEEILVKLDQLIDEIRMTEGDSNRLENLVQEARIFLPQRREELAQLSPTYSQLAADSLIKAAVAVEGGLANLGAMQVGNRVVPMPLINRNDLRTHTDYRRDGITQQQLVVPYMNPDSPTEVLRTQMGVTPSEIDQADELISKRALQLMGYKVDMPQNSLMADFQVEDSRGQRYAVDGMQITTGSPIEMQTHSHFGPKNRDGSFMTKDQTQARLEHEMSYQGNVIDAIDNMASRYQLGHPKVATQAGKILRGDHSGNRLDTRDHEYDMLIMPEYSREVRNAPYRQQPRNIVTAPDGIIMADMPAAYDAVRAGQGHDVQVVPNYGGNNNRGQRRQLPYHKVNITMDRDTQVGGDRVFIDAVQQEPLVAQLLNKQAMNRYRVR